MNESMDRALADWLREGPEHGPREGLEQALAATRRTTQRPGWSFPERWLPMQLTIQRVPALRPIVYIALVALLVLALAVAALIASQPRLPAPFGPAANGLIAYDAGGTVYVHEWDGSAARPIEGGLGYNFSPTFSRDGTQLAFWSSPTRGDDPAPLSSQPVDIRLFVAPVDAGSPAREVSGDVVKTGRFDVAPGWSLDGKRIYFAGVRRDGPLPRTSGLFAASTDGSGIASIGNVQAAGPVVMSPDGQWLAFREESGTDTTLSIVRTDGTDHVRLATAPLYTDAFTSIWWSPDSTRLLIDRNAFGVVETVGLDRSVTPISRSRELGGAREAAWSPSWSPDGRRIAYIAAPPYGDQWSRIVVANADGTGHRDLGSPVNCRMLIWSPDSTYLVGRISDCTVLTRIKVDDPATSTKIRVPGEMAGQMSWQRIAP